MSDTTEAMRAAFEAHQIEMTQWPAVVERDTGTGYVQYMTQAAWEIWQRAWQAAHPTPTAPAVTGKSQDSIAPAVWVLEFLDEQGISRREVFFHEEGAASHKEHNEIVRGLACEITLYAEITVKNPEDTKSGPEGDWYCEEHPSQLMNHDGCNGAGVPACARIDLLMNQLRLARQETRETAFARDEMAAAARRLAPAATDSTHTGAVPDAVVIKSIMREVWESNLPEKHDADGLSITERDLRAILGRHVLAAQPSPERNDCEPVAWCALTAGGKIAYFDGKPIVMPGPVGNRSHPTPLYTAPPPPAERHYCESCGKRLGSTLGVHTCTPPGDAA